MFKKQLLESAAIRFSQ